MVGFPPEDPTDVLGFVIGEAQGPVQVLVIGSGGGVHARHGSRAASTPNTASGPTAAVPGISCAKCTSGP